MRASGAISSASDPSVSSERSVQGGDGLLPLTSPCVGEVFAIVRSGRCSDATLTNTVKTCLRPLTRRPTRIVVATRSPEIGSWCRHSGQSGHGRVKLTNPQLLVYLITTRIVTSAPATSEPVEEKTLTTHRPSSLRTTLQRCSRMCRRPLPKRSPGQVARCISREPVTASVESSVFRRNTGEHSQPWISTKLG